jgi:hypothetical protein
LNDAEGIGFAPKARTECKVDEDDVGLEIELGFEVGGSDCCDLTAGELVVDNAG